MQYKKWLTLAVYFHSVTSLFPIYSYTKVVTQLEKLFISSLEQI